MKKILVFTVIFSFIFLAGNVQAKFPDDLPGPNIMPDSHFYFLKIWYEKIVLFFTIGAMNKAERYKAFAEKRAYEAREMIKKGKEDLAEKQREIYKNYLNKARESFEKALQTALRQGRESLQQELERGVEDIKIKIKESINLW